MTRGRILLISYYFAPQNVMGAVRPTKLAKYLTRLGWEVTVLCGAGMPGPADPTLARDMAGLHDVRVMREWNPLRDYKARQAGGGASGGGGEARPARQGFKHRAADAVYQYLRWLADRSFGRQARRELTRLRGPFDAVISSYGPYSVHEVAARAKRMGLAARWIADFRDEADVPFAWQRVRLGRYLRGIRREADVLSAVSQGFLEMMGFEDVGRVLSNGFDPEELVAPEPREEPRRLRVAYVGQMIDGRRNLPDRDLTPAFSAFAALIREGALRREELELVYAGGQAHLFLACAKAAGLEDRVLNLGRVPRERSIAIQRSADVLLMASFHTSRQRGILTGKLFEYLMINRPILCCVAGDLTGSGVRQVLLETGAGLCHEQAGGAADDAALLAWLSDLASRWRAGRPLTEGRDAGAVERYAYPALAQTLSDWLDEPCVTKL